MAKLPSKEEIINYLNVPLKELLPHGYQSCLNCGVYEHHPKVYCRKCGKKLELQLEHNYLAFTFKINWLGSGPKNTVDSLVQRKFNCDYPFHHLIKNNEEYEIKKSRWEYSNKIIDEIKEDVINDKVDLKVNK
jgi:hypothetical protein